ncbi:C2 domain containing protein [Trema orientale]|uniref:C2 domain containing protein n=1 Tax=Trema orientale TaxID=63057 RepID=A0A2P5CNR9_TREOI|nr:C2 domain containing protein [Trema orientale]
MSKFYSSSSSSSISISSRTIEITVLSAENLKINRRSIKKNAFAVVRSNVGNDFRTTVIDTDGGSNPKWNHKLVLDLPVHAPALTVEVHCKTPTGNKLVGTATVPVSDFSGGYVPENYLQFLSYRLRDQRGESNGIINLSVRTKVPLAPEYSCSAASASSSAAMVLGVPVAVSGVVTGLPVCSA